MTNIDKIVEDVEAQLRWRGPNDKPQGIITLSRNDMTKVLDRLKELEELLSRAGPMGDMQ